jgi:hypothetical protein
MDNLMAKKRRRFRFWLVLGIFFLLLALLIGTIYFALNSSWLTVKDVSAPDLPGVSRSDILVALEKEMYGSSVRAWLDPKNILFWKLGSSPKTLSGLPALKNLAVQADLLKRSVAVSAEERKLWGVICREADSACYGLDENGVVFVSVPFVSGSLILRVDDTNSRLFTPGQPVFSKAEWFDGFKDSIEALRRNGFRPISVSIGDLALREWTVRTAEGPDFRFSLNFTPENFDSVLKGLGEKLDLEKTEYVDFRVPNRIYYK